MPIWMEVLVLSLCAYVAGLAIGWSLWGRQGSDLEKGLE